MTFLELVNALKVECSVSGSGIPTLTGSTGETARLQTWIARAYEEIQGQYHDWKFLHSSGSFTLSSASNIVSAPSDLSIWDASNLYNGSNEKMEVIEYAELDSKIDESEAGEPSLFVIQPNGSLMTYPFPDASYTYSYDYYTVPDVMAGDSSEPVIPAQFQYLIVARAMVFYGNYESAPEIKQQGIEIGQDILRRLKNHQLSGKQQTYGRNDYQNIQIIPE